MWKLLNCKMIPAKCPKGRGQGRHRQCKDKAKEQGRHTDLCLYFTLLEEEFRFMVGRSHCTPLRPSQRKTQANITHKRGSGQPLPTAGKCRRKSGSLRNKYHAWQIAARVQNAFNPFHTLPKAITYFTLH